EFKSMLKVFRRRRQKSHHLNADLRLLADKRDRRFPHRPVGNQARLRGEALRLFGKGDEAFCRVFVGCGFRYGPDVEIVDLPVPNEIHALAPAGWCEKNPATIAGGDRSLLGSEQSERFRCLIPPNDLWFDLVERGESAIRAGWCSDLRIPRVGRDAVGERRELERVAGSVWQRALAGKDFKIEQVRNRGG